MTTYEFSSSRLALLCLAVFPFLVSCSASVEGEAREVRMDRSRLNIGAYCLSGYARSEQHIKDIADCGIDFVIQGNLDRQTLDLFSKYGIGAVTSHEGLPGWWGGDGSNAGQMAQKNGMEVYKKAIDAFQDHPAIWGLDLGDEPSALDFPYYGEVFSYVDANTPKNIFPYLNLYPNYASVAKNTGEETVNQLGTETYAQHISEYCRCVPSDYLCYDFYVYSCDVASALKNLRVVSDACTASGRSMWIVLQVNSLDPEVWISTDKLRYQAFSAMAFGAELISWACWTAGWWDNQVLDSIGGKTQQYDKLKQVNTELHAIGETYMKYKRLNTHFISFHSTAWLGDANTSTVPSFSKDGVMDLRSEDQAALLVGEMESRDGKCRKALFVCAADDPYDQDHRIHTLSFSAPEKRMVQLTQTDGSKVPLHPSDGKFTFSLESSSAVIIEL